MQHPIEHFYDALIIGSGAAGLSLALRLAPYCQVLLLSKGPLNEGATYYAQGGIAAVLDEEDSLQAHIQDTLIAGAGLCEPERVEFVVRNARQCITWLIDQGVMFDTEHSASDHLHFHLAQEGGHCHRRILHTADTTGKSVTNTLIHQVQTHSSIRILEHCHAIDLITSHKVKSTPVQRVMGAYIWCCQQQKIATVYSKVVVLATGGASHVYQYTTNPNIASGDGIAMAWRAGCRVANLEFNQFHPTCLYHPQARNFLLTEALRGEGAVLRLPDGHRFMPAFDARAELAPRDIVARAIDQEMKRLGSDALYLDISHRHPDFIVQHFPNLYHKLKALGFDLAQTAIPVVPAAHYTCGGVMVDRHGQSDLRGLYAIGEVSYTGLHGANRLGSNSLLECLVYAWSSATHIIQQLPQLTRADRLPSWDESQVRCAEEAVLIQHNWHELRLLMWDYVGIVRTTERLQRALRRIELLQQEVQEYYSHFHISTHLLELRNLVQVAKLMVHCALSRQESRGLHYTLDYPQQQLQPKPTILQP